MAFARAVLDAALNVVPLQRLHECLPWARHREGDDSWASDSGVKMQICLMKSILTRGNKDIQYALNSRRDLYFFFLSWETFTFRRTNIFINGVFLPEGRHPLITSAVCDRNIFQLSCSWWLTVLYPQNREMAYFPGLPAISSEFLCIIGRCVFFSELHFFVSALKLSPPPCPPNI